MPTYTVSLQNGRLSVEPKRVSFGRYRAFYAVSVIVAGVTMIVAVFSL